MSSKTSRQLDSSVNRSRRATSGDLTWTVNAVEQYAVPEAHTCDRGKGTRQLRSIHIPRTARRERLNGSQTSAKTTAHIERTAAVAEVQQALLGSVWQRVSKLKRRSAHRRQNKICLPRWTRQLNGWTTLFSLLKCHLEHLTCWRLVPRCKLSTQKKESTSQLELAPFFVAMIRQNRTMPTGYEIPNDCHDDRWKGCAIDSFGELGKNFANTSLIPLDARVLLESLVLVETSVFAKW